MDKPSSITSWTDLYKNLSQEHDVANEHQRY